MRVYTDNKPGIPGRYFSVRALDMDTIEAQTVLPKLPREHGKIRVKGGFYPRPHKWCIDARRFARDVDDGVYTLVENATEAK